MRIYVPDEVVGVKLDCVGEDSGFDGLVNAVEATILVECRSDFETIASLKGPELVCAWFVMEEFWPADGANCSGRQC